MSDLFFRLFKYLKKQIWSLIVAYMIGLHNFYHGDNKSADDIAIKVEVNEAQENNRMDDPPEDSSANAMDGGTETRSN